MRLDFIGFAPDLDPATPGVLTDCDAMVPTQDGMAAQPSLVVSGVGTLAATPTSAYRAALLDGSVRVFAATATKIYEAGASSWTDRSRAASYTGVNRQRFCMFGSITLATNRSEKIGASAAGAIFVDIAAAPAAAIIVTASGFVMAFDTNDATYGDRPDGWWCSGIRDHTIWAPAAATQAANGRLLDSPGRITAGHALGSDVVAYKPDSMYLGRYVGPDIIWAWQRVPGFIGTSGNESVAVVDTAHYFVGPNDFYMYDGTVPRSFGEPVRKWFFSDLNQSYRDKIIAQPDIANNLIYFFYPSNLSSTGALDSVLIYNYVKDQWGKWSKAVDTVVLYSAASITYDGMGTPYATWDDLPAIAYDSPYWLSGSPSLAVFGTGSLQMSTLTGTPGGGYIITGIFGDPTTHTMLRRAYTSYRTAPSAEGVVSNYYAATPDGPYAPGQTVLTHDGRADLHTSARWHKLSLTIGGPVCIRALDIDLIPAGKR